jgi:tetratricopeptide (TPR) repeat protein
VSASFLERAIECHKQDSFSEAERLYRLVLGNDPQNATALHMLGVICFKSRRLNAALKLLESAIIVLPKSAEIFYDLGLCFFALGSYEKALNNFSSALNLSPNFYAAELQKGITCKKLGLIKDARLYFHSFTQKAPRKPHGYLELGNLERELGNLKDALGCYEQACRVAPKLSEVWHNKGTALADLGNIDDGIKALSVAIKLDPKHLQPYLILAQLINERDGLKAAITIIELAIALDPNYLWSHITKADILFAGNDLKGGWREYAWRNKSKKAGGGELRIYSRAEVVGRDVLLTPEQGLGEQILFSSMLPELLQDAKTVCVQCDKRLASIFRRSFQGLMVIEDKPLSVGPTKYTPPLDIIMPFGSLGNIYRPDFSSFPSHKGYLVPDNRKVDYFRKKYLAMAGGKPVVGISWRSFNPLSFWRKSAPLSLWKDILLRDDIFLVNVQYGEISKEVANLAAKSIKFYTDSEVIHSSNLEDPLAQMAAMDLLVSTSNTSVHLAGALNIDTLLLLPNRLSHLWYWFPKKVVNPWYPSVKHILQNKPLSWQQSLSDANRHISQILFKTT